MVSKNIRATATTSMTERVNSVTLSEADRLYQRAHYHTLSNDFLMNHEKASKQIGDKVNRLMTEITEMTKKDPFQSVLFLANF